MLLALKLLPSWNGYLSIVDMNCATCCCAGTNNHMLSAYQRKYIPDSFAAVSKGSACKLVMVGHAGTLRYAVLIPPSSSAKAIFHSFQRTAFKSPAALKYNLLVRGDAFSWPLKKGKKL